MNNYQKLVEGFMNPETLETQKRRMTNALLGLAGEVGEACDIWKKHTGHQHDFDRENFKKELGDVYFYLAEACSSVDTTLEEIAQLNVDKLNARYEGKPWSADASKAKRDEVLVGISGTATSPKIKITSIT